MTFNSNQTFEKFNQVLIEINVELVPSGKVSSLELCWSKSKITEFRSVHNQLSLHKSFDIWKKSKSNYMRLKSNIIEGTQSPTAYETKFNINRYD